MRKKFGLQVLAISIALVLIASSVMVDSSQKGEKGIDEGEGKGVISLLTPPFIGIAGASVMQGDDGGSGAPQAGTSFIEEEAGIAEYTNIEQEIVLQKTQMDNYNDARSEMGALSSATTYYENFTMIVGEKKCSSTHNSCWGICWWNYYTSGRPSFIGFSSEFYTYCIKILKEAKPGTYEFQVRYHKGSSPFGPLPLRHKINITVNITECQDCSILTGVVTDLRDNPVYNAEIYVKKRDYKSIDYHTDLSGFYSTCPLRNGTYTVSVSPPSGVNLLDKVITANITQNTTLNITLQCGGILTGKVMDTNGKPVSNAKVSVSGPTSGYDYTEINGTYSIIRLKNGTYSVTITPPSGANLLEQKTTANVTECQTTYLNSTLQFGGILAGRVTYENGTGIYNARVKASGPSYKSAYTNTTGYYCIIRLLAGNYTVTASPPSGANLLSNSTSASVALGETTTVDLILTEAGIIAGRVTYENGTGIYDARVKAGPSYKSTYTNTTGYYRIIGLLAGNYTVTTYPPSGANLLSNSTEASVTLGETTAVNLILPEAGIIAGRVTYENGTWIDHARVTASGPSSKSAYTNTTGYYCIEGLKAGTYTVKAYPPSGANLLSDSTTASVTLGDTTTVDLILPEAGIIAGRVTYENGTWIDHARVTASGPSSKSAYTNTTGYYCIEGLKAGTYTVKAYPPSGANLLSDSTTASVTLGDTTTVDLILPEAGIIAGRVTYENGTWIDHARVTASGPSSKSAYTNTTGYYCIEGLKAGTYTVKAYPPSGANLLSDSTTASVTLGDTTTVDLILPEAGIIAGRVTYENGTWIDHARVTASGPSSKSAYTNTTGYYCIEGLKAGTYTVKAYPPSGANLLSDSTTASVTLGDTTTVDFILPEAGIIAGRVTYENGTWIDHARVTASGPSSKSAYTNTTGYYCIEGLKAGTYTVKAYPPSGANLLSDSTTASVTLGDTTTVDLILPEAGIIAGRVTYENGTWIDHARVTASGPSSKSAYTNTTGYYCIEGLKAGTYTVKAYPPSGANLLSDSTTASVTLGDTTTVDLILPEAGIIAGRVTYENGTWIDHARVTASGPSSKSAYTNTTGYYCIEGLKAGTYTVKAYPPSGANLLSDSTTASVTLGDTTTVDFILPEAGIIAGRVTYENGTGIDHARVVTSGPSSKSTYTNTTGYYRIVRLLAGNYAVTASPPSGANLLSNSTAASVTLGETTTVDLILSEAGIITGRVTYENGTGIYNARVVTSGPSSKSTYTNTTGYYRIVRLLAGNYAVTASPPSGANLLSNSTAASITLGETKVMDFVLHPREDYP